MKKYLTILVTLLLVLTQTLHTTNKVYAESKRGPVKPCGLHCEIIDGVTVCFTDEMEKAHEEKERQAAEEAERKAQEEAAKKAEEERKAQEEAAKKAEQERLEKEKAEAEAKAKAEAEKKAQEEAERKAKEEAEKARQEQERIAKEKAEAEAKAKAEAEKKAQEEKAKKEAEEAARLAAEKAEAERLAREEAERKAAEEKAKKEAEEKARLEAERKAAEEAARLEAERLAREEAEAREKLNNGKGNNVTPKVTLEDAYYNSNLAKGAAYGTVAGDIYNGTQKGKPDLSGGAVDEAYDTTDIENLVYEKLSAMREKMGLLPLTRTDENSRDWAQVMATTGLFEHANVNPNARNSHDYAANHSMVGENIAVTMISKYATAEQIADKLNEMWNNSPGHYANRTENCYYSEKPNGGCLYDIAVVRSAAGAFWAVERIGK